jgi:hypothetical protein
MNLEISSNQALYAVFFIPPLIEKVAIAVIPEEV